MPMDDHKSKTMCTALIGLDGFTKIKLNKRQHKVVCIKKSRSENSQKRSKCDQDTCKDGEKSMRL